jgi:hypothetical protein
MRQKQRRNFKTCDKQDSAVNPTDPRKLPAATGRKKREKHERGEDHADEANLSIIGNDERHDKGGKCGQRCADALGDPIKTSHSGPENTSGVSHAV